MQSTTNRLYHLRAKLARGRLQPSPSSTFKPCVSCRYFKGGSICDRLWNAQLTLDDAIHYDQEMRMGRFTFDLQGQRLMREATPVEREAIRRHHWLVRNTTEVSIRGELTEMMKQIGDWPTARAADRTFPQICIAPGTEPVKLPVGLRYVIAQESTNLKAEVEACATTYAHWYQTRFVDRMLSEVAHELKLSLEAICTSLCLGSNPDVIASEFDPDRCLSTENDRNYWRNDHWRSASFSASVWSHEIRSWSVSFIVRDSRVL